MLSAGAGRNWCGAGLSYSWPNDTGFQVRKIRKSSGSIKMNVYLLWTVQPTSIDRDHGRVYSERLLARSQLWKADSAANSKIYSEWIRRHQIYRLIFKGAPWPAIHLRLLAFHSQKGKESCQFIQLSEEATEHLVQHRQPVLTPWECLRPRHQSRNHHQRHNANRREDQRDSLETR